MLFCEMKPSKATCRTHSTFGMATAPLVDAAFWGPNSTNSLEGGEEGRSQVVLISSRAQWGCCVVSKVIARYARTCVQVRQRASGDR